MKRSDKSKAGEKPAKDQFPILKNFINEMKKMPRDRQKAQHFKETVLMPLVLEAAIAGELEKLTEMMMGMYERLIGEDNFNELKQAIIDGLVKKIERAANLGTSPGHH